MSELRLIRSKFKLLRPLLDERMRPLWAANEATALGRGGTSLVAQATGMSRHSILKGLQDLRHLNTASTRTPAFSHLIRPPSRAKEGYRIRRPGGGRKLTENKHPTIVAELEQLLDNEVAGDPMGQQKWVRSSLAQLSKRLKEKGYRVSPATISRLLKGLGFSMKTNKRKQLRSKCPERDEQFRYIDSQRQSFTVSSLPIISVDTKKELIGEFRNNGRVWCRQADEVNEHDFPDAAECRAVPFGIYDVTRNKGYVVVGTSHDTPEFAVNAIIRWWKSDGRAAYPKATQLLILADGGGSNSSRTRAWRLNLQEKLSNRFGIVVTVCHYPPGCSKWNPVEHRLFSQISRNWAGRPLRTLKIMLGYIRGTTTKTGLRVKAFLDDDLYKKQKLRMEDLERLNLRTHTVCPSWNYTISPRQ
jgi:Rhodopirellula transposase DDE domain